MKRILLPLLCIYFLTFQLLLGEDEELLALIKKYPTIVSSNASLLLKEDNAVKIKFYRTDLMELYSMSQITCKDNQLFFDNNPLAFLDQDNSKKEYPDYYKRINKAPLVIYKWEIEVDKEGAFFLTKDADIGSEGFLNNAPIVILNNGIVSKKGSGKLWVPLSKGSNILFLSTNPRVSSVVSVISEPKFDQIQKEVLKKLKSDAKDDLIWLANQFLPYLGSLKNGCHTSIIPFLSILVKKNILAENADSINLIMKIIQSCKAEYDGYMVEKYIYQNFPNIYFYLDAKEGKFDGFIINNNLCRTKFLEQLIFDGQYEIIDVYFNKSIEVISNLKDYRDKDKFIAKIYVDRFLCYFRIGRVSDSINLYKETREKYELNTAEIKYVDYTLNNYRDGLLLKDEDIIFISTFDETLASAIKDAIDAYDGKPEAMNKAFAMYSNLPNKLVKRNNLIVSLQYYFLLLKDENPKFKEDFAKLCQEKIQVKLEKAKESKDLNLLQELIDKYDVIIPLPEIRLLLMEEYFLKGSFLKALSQANYIFEKYPALHSQIVSKITYLEGISDILEPSRKVFADKFKKAEVKIKGVLLPIEKMNGESTVVKNDKLNLGRFLKTIPLHPTHIQYRNHFQIKEYQPIEPIFTDKNILFNGGNYLINYSIKDNEVSWSYQSAYEYKKETEPGPHQKRFITTHAGNQYFMLTNKDFSAQKTVKSFDLNGKQIWDVAERGDGLTEEPVCTPIESQGKLFCLSYSNNETINTFNYSVIDSHSGKIISRTQLSLIPNKVLDFNSYPFYRNINTFTHDQHFTKDDSHVYGYSGTGVLFKADASTGNILWAKGVSRSSFYHNSLMDSEYGYAPSGYIKVFGNVILNFMPDVQLFAGNHKETSEVIWKSKFYRPKFIHARENLEALYFSDFATNDETSLFKIDPQTGKIIWQTTSNGLKITGEGDLIGNKLYLPSEKALIVLDSSSGAMLEVLPYQLQPIKIRSYGNYSVIFTTNSVQIFQNSGNYNFEQIKEIEVDFPATKIIEPDTKGASELSFENINLELAIKVPETYFAGGGYWKRTRIIKTSKLYHYLMFVDEHVTLFREGYTQSNGQMVPPAIIWYGQYPCYGISEDIFYESVNGKITASNLFTREKKWEYQYQDNSPVYLNKREKINPIIAVSNQYIAFQTQNNSIRVLDKLTQKVILEFYSSGLKSICMDGNYLITLGVKGSEARCYDISQKGKEIWMQSHNNRSDIYAENGNFIFIKYSDPSINFYDLATGKLKVQAKPTNGYQYTMNQWQLDSKYLFAYNMLYDATTGAPLAKFKEFYKVENGGYIGLTAIFGSEGVYLYDGKEYALKSRCVRDHNNVNFSAIRKGNRLTLLTAWWIETFEITGDKLVLIEAIRFNSGYVGDGQFPRDMQLMPLENCLFQARNDEMNFFRNFDVNLKYENIKTFRVENKKKYDWPHSELYPEIEIDEKNWIGYLNAKPKRKIAYQAFADEKFAYLKLRISPLEKLDSNFIFYISGNGKTNNVALRWNPDLWDKCQISSNLVNNFYSWREVDLSGNIFLYMKFSLDKVFTRNFKTTYPDLNIEFRQNSNELCEGLFRFGGAYHNGRKNFPWLNYQNEEADLLSDYELRSSMYENKENFYPQGEDFILWLKDRKRFYSIDANILLLNKMLGANAKYYCSVNILSALFLEEVQLLKNSQPNLEELNDEFNSEIIKIIKKLDSQANQAGMIKEWRDYALSIISIEIFPFKLDYNSDWFSKAIYGFSVRGGKGEVLNSSFSERSNPIKTAINQPYIEWILPGLMAGFPKELNCESVYLLGVSYEKTGIGRMRLYTTAGSQEFCNRNGEMSNAELKLKSVDGYYKEEPAKLISTYAYHKGMKFNCITIGQPMVRSLMIPIPQIKSPAILKSTGQTPESILAGLEQITMDNNNGPMMLQDYLTLSGAMNEDELKNAYGKFLHSLKNNPRAAYHALRNIYQKNANKKDLFDFMVDVMKNAKLTTTAPRLFFLEYRNIFLDKKSFSFMGPIDKDLINSPEKDLNPETTYKTENSSHQFAEGLGPKKGGIIYLASKITVLEKDRIYLIARSSPYTKCIFSIWVNGKPVIENIDYTNFGSLFSQNISLNAGENILLIKITGSEDFEWPKNFAMAIGDNFGAPIKGLEMKPINK